MIEKDKDFKEIITKVDSSIKRLETKVKASKYSLLLLNLANSLNWFIGAIDPKEETFIFINEKWEKYLGWSFEEMASKPFIEFVHPNDVEKTQKVWEGTHAINIGEIFVNRYLCKNNTYKELYWITLSSEEYNIASIVKNKPMIIFACTTREQA